ncbi:MAG TPA: methylenetetrahydrofolate reductase [Sphingomonas sp.]|nr:methylenetetrahydrofolate reductase [Sphingomonas sp.]
MTRPIIHPNWARPPTNMVDGYSLEMTARDIDSLRAAAPGVKKDTPIAVTFLPGEDLAARLEATRLIRTLGFEPMPHFSARRIRSVSEFEEYLEAAVTLAGVKRCFVIAGDPSEPEGPFFDSNELIASGTFERMGITAIGLGGHPEGHPNMTDEQCWTALEAKCAEVDRRGMAPLIVTQFGFDPDAILTWLRTARIRGIKAPVRIGVPGPAGIKTLMRFAARCGVGASTAVLAKYGISITQLLGSAGPDRLLAAFQAGLKPDHHPVRLHFYPFGGLEKTVAWINAYDRAHR